MRCTVKKTFEIARETGNDLIVQVKNNQPGLLRRLEHLIATTAPIEVHDSRNLARNRQEDRRVEVYAPGSALDGSDWGSLVTAVVCVTRQTSIRSAATGLWTRREETALSPLRSCFRPKFSRARSATIGPSRTRTTGSGCHSRRGRQSHPHQPRRHGEAAQSDAQHRPRLIIGEHPGVIAMGEGGISPPVDADRA